MFDLPEGNTWNLFGGSKFLKDFKDSTWQDQLRKRVTGRDLLSKDTWLDLAEKSGLLGITDEEEERRRQEKLTEWKARQRMPHTTSKHIQDYAASESKRKQDAQDIKDKEERAAQWKEMSNMLLLKSIAEGSQAERPSYVSSTKAGSSVSPVRSLMTAPMRGSQGNQRDLLNYIYGGGR